MKKHAYLILCHHDFENLYRIINYLDSNYNDFYIHIDKKVKDIDKLKLKLKSLVKDSEIYFVPSINLEWGGYNITRAELSLFKESLKNRYHYYHLLSGQDLPIKNKDEIYNYFENSNEKDFIYFETDDEKKIKFRYNVYYFFNDNDYVFKKGFKLLGKLLVKVQRIIKFSRKNNLHVYKGSQWLSITHTTLKKILDNEELISKTFKYSYCSDELFVQTILFNIDKNYFNNQKYSNARYIKWEKNNNGHPRVLTEEDFQDLINSNCMFARKFDSQKSSVLIEMLDKVIR